MAAFAEAEGAGVDWEIAEALPWNGRACLP